MALRTTMRSSAAAEVFSSRSRKAVRKQSSTRAITRLSTVSRVRSLLRSRLRKASFLMIPSLPRNAGRAGGLRGAVDQPALFQLEQGVGALGGARVVGHHDDGLAELLVELHQQVEHVLGT